MFALVLWVLVCVDKGEVQLVRLSLWMREGL